MSIKFTTTRICAGEYEIRPRNDIRPGAGVDVSKVYYPGDGTYWIAAAKWDAHLYTDPLLTKRDAVYNAKRMIEDDLYGNG